MGRKPVLVSLVCVLSSVASASNIQNVGLIATVQPASAGSFGYAVTADAAGNFTTVGSMFSGSSTAFFLNKYSPNGQPSASTSGLGPGGLSKAQYAVADNQGNIYVAGTELGVGTDTDWIIFKFHGGQYSYFTGIDGAASRADKPCGIAVDSSGNLYVAGTVDQVGQSSNVGVVKYDSSGNVVWKNLAVSQNADAIALDMCLAPNGKVYICGQSEVFPKFTVWTVDTNGSLLATNQDSNFTGEAQHIKSDSHGNIAAVGTSSDGMNPNVLTTMYLGSTNFSQYYPAANASLEGGGVDFDLAGNIYALGTISPNDAHNQTLVLKYDATGSLKWQQTFAGLSTANKIANATALVVDRYGDAYVSGYSYFSDSFKEAAFLLKYNSVGQLMFSAYHGVLNNSEYVNSLFMDPNFDLYTTGYVVDPGNGYSQITEHWAQAAIANNDSYTTLQNKTLTVNAAGVLTNDYFTKGATVAVKTTTTHGTLTLQANGAFKYVPNTGFKGPDTFQYVAQKLAGGGSSNAATVSIKVG
jgi:hypothetical protein